MAGRGQESHHRLLQLHIAHTELTVSVLCHLQTAMKHVSDYYMFYESALVPWVHYVPFGEYDKDDVLPVCGLPAYRVQHRAQVSIL